MAKQVQGQVAGGEVKVYGDVATVGDLRQKIGLDRANTATVNGEPAEDAHTLRDYDFVGFAKATAGGI